MRFLTLLAALVAAPGCYMFHDRDREAEPEALPECDPVATTGEPAASAVDVDLLFVIDNSNSMTEEQTSLAAELPALIRALATGDVGGDGTLDFTPVRSMHLGVVTTDMGTGGFEIPTCADPHDGDDGVLRTEGAARPECEGTYPSFLSYEMGSGDATRLATDFACVAAMGTGGCGFEQQLEAALKALTPGTGHGDGANAGFVREGSVLGIIFLTDEEDCSASDPELYSADGDTYRGNLNLRCYSYPDALHPVERYIEGFAALRASRPESLVVAAIAGVPPHLVADPDAISYRGILSDPDMREMVDPADPNRLRPSCNVPGRGLAFPPRRIVETVAAFGDRGIVQSICQEDFSPVIRVIADRLAVAIRRTACER